MKKKIILTEGPSENGIISKVMLQKSYNAAVYKIHKKSYNAAVQSILLAVVIISIKYIYVRVKSIYLH